MEKPKYSVRVYPLSRNICYVSQIYTGLFDLAANGVIELEFTWAPLVRIHERNDPYYRLSNFHIFYLEVTDLNGKQRKVCYDLQDGPGISSRDGLEECDIYFKRSYSSDFLNSSRADLQISRPELKNKIRPYGLNYPCKSNFETNEFKRTLIGNLASGSYRTHSRRAFKEIVKAASNLRFPITNPTRMTNTHILATTDIEIEPQVPAESLILFQTRLHDPERRADREETARLNELRVETLHALKSTFGDRFIGGLTANDYTLGYCPDLITKEETSREKYFKLVHKCLIAVSTRGLVSSTGWRLPEFLSASRCIISEPLIYGLPQTLENNINCIFFSTPEDSVKACNRLLDDFSFAQRMRENNYKYYCDNVKPSSLVMNTLDTAMQ